MSSDPAVNPFGDYFKTLTPERAEVVYDLIATSQPEKYKLKRGTATMWGSIANLKKNGYVPKWIIDVGAYLGNWTLQVREIYPDAENFMVEANVKSTETLEAVVKHLKHGARYAIALLGATEQEKVPYFVMESGSSVLPEKSMCERETAYLQMRTLDEVIGNTISDGPVFLKLDVQGYELEVLKGATFILKKVEVILMEVSLLPYNKGAPLFAEVVAAMKSYGFVVYDICGQARREADNALFQADLIFVREENPLRSHKKFWAHLPDDDQSIKEGVD